MGTAELKNYLHKIIVETNDQNILSQIKDYINSLQQDVPNWQKEITLKRLEEYENGSSKARSWKEARKDIFIK